MSQTETAERVYCAGRYFGTVVHLRDPRVIDRTRCRLRVQRYVPEAMAEKMGVCSGCEQDEKAEGETC